MIERLDIPKMIMKDIKINFTYKDIVTFIPVIPSELSSLAITVNYNDIQDEPMFSYEKNHY